MHYVRNENLYIQYKPRNYLHMFLYSSFHIPALCLCFATLCSRHIRNSYPNMYRNSHQYNCQNILCIHCHILSHKYLRSLSRRNWCS